MSHTFYELMREGRKRFTRLRPVLLFVPATVYLLIIYGYPLLELIGRSIGAPQITGQYYVDFVQTETHIAIFARTFLIGILGAITCVIAAYPLAYLLSQVGPRLRYFLLVLVVAPWITSSLVRTFAWLLLLAREGPVNSLLTSLGILGQPLELLGTSTAVYIGLVHVHTPLAVLPLYSAMKRIDDRLLLVAQGSGATPLRTFIHIYLPLSLPGIAGAGILVFISMLGFYVTPLILGGSGDLFVANLIDIQVNGLVRWEYGAALGFILMGITFAIIVTYNKIFGLDTLKSGLE